MTPTDSADLDLETLPGHFIRRLQQIAVAVFLQETESFGVTPVQYASLQAVRRTPGMDQRSLARSIGLDTSTMAGVIDRLESRGLMMRSASPDDRRVRLLSLTDEGETLLGQVEPAVLRAQTRMLEPLPRKEQQVFMRMLREIVKANNDLSRAPSQD